MSKHTPAPWAIKFRNDSSAYISMGNPAEGEHKQFDIEFDARYPSDVADAKLISAAPDLLAACQALLDEFPALDSKRLERIKAISRAAIAKATGEQQ